MNHNLAYLLDWPNLHTLGAIEMCVPSKAPKQLGNPCIASNSFAISLSPYKSRREDYKIRKEYYSMSMQAIVDANYCFTYLHVGLVGRNHNSYFQKIQFYNMAINGQLSGPNNRPSAFNSNVDINPFINIDKAYSLATWLIMPFKPNPDMQLTFDYVMFNMHHSKT